MVSDLNATTRFGGATRYGVCVAAENVGTLPTDNSAIFLSDFQVTINKNALASDAPIAAKKMADPGG